MHFSHHHHKDSRRGPQGRHFGPQGHYGGQQGARGRGGRFGGESDGGGPGGRGGRRRLFDNEALRLILLTLIAQAPRHGYDLIREIDARSGAVYVPSPGVVYPTLTLLADMELIAEQPGPSSRKLFTITENGTAFLAEQADALAKVMDRLAQLAKKAEHSDGAPIRRAMHNLGMAVRGRLEKEGADAQTMFDVVALIDETASKIERL